MTKMIARVSFFVCFLCLALVNAKSNRILGGDRATPGQFKYQISLQSNNEHECGGSIIADQYILTAAHCVIAENGRFRPRTYQVVADSTDLRTQQSVRIDVEKIYVLEEYVPNDMNNDIAVLKLHRGLGLDSNPNLEKINLPSRSEPSHAGETAVITGYGLTYIEQATDPVTHQLKEVQSRWDGRLKYAMVNIIDHEVCRREFFHDIDTKHICGQCIQRGKRPEGICKGDSGGPLVSGKTIIGVASMRTINCDEDKFPAIYTRVSSFLDFIAKAMEDVKTSGIRVQQIQIGESSGCSKGHEKSIVV